MKVLLVMQDQTRVTFSTSHRGAAALIASVYGSPFVEQLAITEVAADGSTFWSTVWRVADDRRTFQWYYDYESLKAFLLMQEESSWLRDVVPEKDGRNTISIEEGINAMWRKQAKAWNYE